MPIRCIKEDGLLVIYKKRDRLITTYITDLFNLCLDCGYWWWVFDSPEACRAYQADDMQKLGFKITKCSRQLTFMDNIPKRKYLK
jgi:hypothetical protein